MAGATAGRRRAGNAGPDGSTRGSRAAGSSGRAHAPAAPSGAPAPSRAPAGLRLTGRGALLGIFALCLLGILAAGWLGWGLLTGGAFIAACVLAAALTQSSDLLTVVISPPALFLVAVICAKALTSSGNLLLSTAAGTLITLANSAPWLLAGTALSLIITFSRGLRHNIVALSRELDGPSPGAPGRSPDTGPG